MTVSSISPLRFGSVSAVTATRGVNDPEVGSVCQEGDETYRYVYNNGNSQISIGQMAVLSAVTGYSVTVSSTTMVDIPVGVCKHATLTTGTYGWLVTRGFTPVKAGPDSGLAAGTLLIVGADGAWQAKAGASTAYSQVNDPSVYGKVMIQTASAGLADGYVQLY
jgi:hypothetical protein